MIKALVQAVLLANAGVTALVGTRVQTTGQPPLVNQVLPLITMERVSTVTGYSFDGPGLVRVRIQVDAWAKSDAEAGLVAKAVRDAFHDHVDEEDGIQDVEAGPVRDFYEADTKLHRVSSDYFATVRDQAV